jgi:hypothetical protein
VGWCANVDEEAIEMTLSLQRFVLPVVQLMAGVSRPSWVALPYFVCSCASLFHWSVTSNYIGLSWMWKPLLFYTGAHISVLYIYQMPFLLHSNVVDAVEYIGLFKVGVPYFPWTEAIQAVSLIALYILVLFLNLDLFHSFYSICISFMLFILGTFSSRFSDVWGFCVPAMRSGE